MTSSGGNRWSGPGAPPGFPAGLLALALILLALPGGAYSGVAVGAATVAVWALLAVALLSGRLDPIELRPTFLAAAGCLAALAAFTALSLSWTSDAGAGFSNAVRLAGYLGVFLLAGLAVRRGGGPAVLIAIAVAGVGVSLIAIGSRLLGLGADAALSATLPAASGRLSFPIGYWNALGAMMALVVPALVWLATAAAGPRRRSLALAALGPPLLAAYMTSSRGAILAAAVGVALLAGLADDRRRIVAIVAVGAATTLPALGAATLGNGILDSPGDGLGRAELLVGFALAGGCLLAYAIGGRVADRLVRLRLGAPRLRTRPLLLAVAVIAAALVAIAGPSTLVGDFRAPPEEARTQGDSGIVSTSGSGRAQFWVTALDAFREAPLKGIGAGGYESYWNRNGSLDTPARNAHSEPLELLAEVGVVGFALFAAFVGLLLGAGLRATRGRDGSAAAAALGVLFAGLVGICIDWTWEVPAVIAPLLVAAALLSGSAFDRPAPAASRHRTTMLRLPAAVATLAVLALAIPSVWSGGVLAIASSRLEASRGALERGELDEAAAAARAAAAIEPWAAEPWLELAGIEQAADNIEAAQRAAAAATERAPADYRPWLLLVYLQSRLDNPRAVRAYIARAQLLAPRILERATKVLRNGPIGAT